MPTEDVFEAFTGEQTRRVILTLNAAFFALTFITLGIIMLFLSHRVAGPALVFERALRAFMKGNFDERTTIRKKDYLQGLSQTLKDLGVHLRDQREQNDAFLSELEQALTAKDVTRAARLLQQFQETRVVEQAEHDPDPEAAAPQAEVPAEEPRTPIASGS